MKVRDVMTTEVATVHPRSSFKHTVERMLAHDVSGLPVVINDRELVGIVTEADLISKEAFDEPLGPVDTLLGFLSGDRRWSGKAAGLTAGDVMTGDVVVVGPDDDLREAARLMLRDGVKRLPVVDDGRLVGVVSRHDILNMFAHDDRASAVLALSADRVAIGPAAAALGLVPRSPVYVDVDTSIRDIATTMADENIGVVLVRGPHQPAGLVSERDLVAALAAGADPDTERARSIMTSDLACAPVDSSVLRVADMMLENEIRHILLVTEHATVGVVSIRDVLMVLADAGHALVGQ